MTDTARRSIHTFLPLAALALFAGLAGAALWDLTGLGRSAQDAATRDYLLAHPEILPQAMQALQQKEVLARIDPARQRLETPFAGAVLGNPAGTVTLVEFSDYACGYCRRSVADVAALIAKHPELRVVVREYPILSPASEDAARMALAAAEQGRFAPFHKAMFEQDGPSPAGIEAAARAAGLDLDAARKAIASGKYDAELIANGELARQLGFGGTPSWVIGDQAIPGAVGEAALAAAIAAQS
jgi:protein-disulfide isomerase